MTKADAHQAVDNHKHFKIFSNLKTKVMTKSDTHQAVDNHKHFEILVFKIFSNLKKSYDQPGHTCCMCHQILTTADPHATLRSTADNNKIYFGRNIFPTADRHDLMSTVWIL